MQDYNQQYDKLVISWSKIYTQIEEFGAPNQFKEIKDFKFNFAFFLNIEKLTKEFVKSGTENSKSSDQIKQNYSDLTEQKKDIIISLKKFIKNARETYTIFTNYFSEISSKIDKIDENDLTEITSFLDSCKFINDLPKELPAKNDKITVTEETQSAPPAVLTPFQCETNTPEFQEALAAEIMRLTFEDPAALTENNTDIPILGSDITSSELSE